MLLARRGATLARGGCTRRCLSVIAGSKAVRKSEDAATDAWPSRLHTTRSQRDMEMLGERLAAGRKTGDVLFLRGYGARRDDAMLVQRDKVIDRLLGTIVQGLGLW